MFPCKLLLQSLITVPKNLQLYTAATVNSSKLSGHTCASFHNVPCVENCKNGTVKNTFITTGIGRENEINARCSTFSIPLEVYKKVRKVNHNSQITKIIHQRTKTNILHSKSRNSHQDTRKPLTVRNGNKIIKHMLEISQSTVRFISSRTCILPPPSSGNNKNVAAAANSDEIPSYKINVKFHGTIPPPTSSYENLIHNQSKDLTESSFSITMSKGRKVRPPSGTEKRCMSTGRIVKANTIKKFNDFNLLQNKESLLKTLNCFIHTTQPLVDEQKTKSLLNLNRISKPVEETKTEIYYSQHFPNQPFSCTLYKTNEDRIEESGIDELKKNRHFIKSYLRPVNLPPPTPKKLKVQTSDSSLPPVYSLDVMNHLSSSTPKTAKSPLLDLLAHTKRAVENVQHENNSFPLNLNFPMAEGMQNNFYSEDDPKKNVYLKMQGNDFRNNSYNSVNDQMTNDNRKSHVFNFSNNNDNNYGKTSFESNSSAASEDYTVDMEKALSDYNTNNDSTSMAKTTTSECNKNNIEEQEDSIYNENSSTPNRQPSNVDNNDYFASTWFKNDSLSRNDGTTHTMNTQMNRNLYQMNDNQENKDHFQASNINNELSTERNYSDVNKIKDNQEYFSNINNTSSTERSDNNIYKMGDNQENKFNFQAFDLSNSTKISENVQKMEENKVFQTSNMPKIENMPKINENQEIRVNFQGVNMDSPLSTELNDSSVPKLDERQEIKVNFQAANMNNTLPTEQSDSIVPKIDENQDNKVNYQASNINNTLSPEMNESVSKIDDIQGNKVNFQALSAEKNDCNVNKMDEPQDNKVNFETFGMNNSMSTAAMNSNNNSVTAESNYNNNMSNVKESAMNSYFRTSNYINSDIPEPTCNNLPSYGEGVNYENKVNMQTSSGINNIMTTMNNKVHKVEENQDANKANMQTSSGIYNTMNTMNNTLPKIEENPAGNQYFNEASNIRMNSYNSQMTNANISPNMHTGVTNEPRTHTPTNIPNVLGNRFRNPKVKKPEKGLMNSFSFMKTSKGLSDLAKSFNHASMFIPKQSIWKKFKFPAPAPSIYDQVNNNNTNNNAYKSMENEKNIPKFKNFTEARNYFVQPENLKKLTPAQVAMYNSILYYENVIKKHSEEMNRQRENLESTQQTLKHRKNKFYKNRHNSDE